MKLAIDTSTKRTLLSLDTGSEYISRRFEPKATQRVIYSELAGLLTPDVVQELDGIVVGLGPGSFTGIKIGAITAKTLAWSRDIPLVGLCSLDIIAAGTPVPDDTEKSLMVAVPSTRGEAYVRLYDQAAGGWTPSGEIYDRKISWDALKDLVDGRDLIVSGEAAEPVSEALKEETEFTVSEEDARYPAPEGIFSLANLRFGQRKTDDPLSLVPMYVRLSQPERLSEKGAE